MTYTELDQKSGAWGFTLGSICGDMLNNAKWSMTKKAFKTAQVTERDLETVMSSATKEGIEVRVKADLTFSGVEFSPKGICSMCRRDWPLGLSRSRLRVIQNPTRRYQPVL